MEDELSIQLNLCSPVVNGNRPIHFFAVYDGHGGGHVSALCKQRLHVLLEEELMQNTYMSGSSSSSSSVNRGQQKCKAAWRRILRRCFLQMDKLASLNCHCGSLFSNCGCPPNRLMGSTAVIAILTDDTIIVANCGDSRAVLSRGGVVFPLSFDHKPDRLDELAIVKTTGGTVINSKGLLRVQGVLAMTRAIGDNYLKPYVLSEPEITFMKRQAEDECLILASDGLWDVVSSETTCQVTRECLQKEAVFSSQSASAAALLTRLAMGRESRDNISIIVVDLKRNHVG